MARYGSGFLYGDGTLYGVGPRGTDAQAFFDALAGQSLAFPAVARPWRRACAEIHLFDLPTWTVGAKLLYVEAGATRTATRLGVGVEQQTLAFTVHHAAYYLTGAGAGLLARGQALCVRWTVTSPDGTTGPFTAGVFLIDAAVSPTGAPEGSVLQVTAVDWMQPTLAAPISTSGWITYPDWTFRRDDYVTAGGTVVDTADSWGTLLAAQLWDWSGQRIRVDSWPQATPADASSAESAFGTATLQIGDAGRPATGYDALTWLWPKVGAFALGYDSDGYLRLMDAKRPRDAGYFVSTDDTVTGALPLPWARPLQVQRSKPQATKVTYFWKGPATATPAGASATPALDDPTLNRGEAVSWSRVHPHIHPPESPVDVQPVVESGVVKEAAGFATFTEFCRYRLGDLLGAADTLTLPVDSAFPPGPLGRRVRVHAPEDDTDGYFLVAGYSQPLSEAAASLALRWLEDA